MQTDTRWTNASVSPALIDAIVRRARIERAEVMRQELAKLPVLFRRLVAYIRAHAWHFPQADARA